MPTDWPTFIENAYREYKKILTVNCRALGGLKVHFNKHGFNHLIRKGKRLRLRKDQVRRIMLIFPAVEILKNEPKIFSQESDKIGKSQATFWTIRGFFKDRWIRVVIRQKNDGSPHFFSVMDE